MMLIVPLAAVIAIVLAYQQQRHAALMREVERLRHTASHLYTLFEQAPLGMAVFDTKGRYIRINRLLAGMNGLAVEDHIGKTLHDLVPAVAEASEAACRKVRETGQPLVDIMIDGCTEARPGVKRNWRVSFHPVFGCAGEVTGVSTTVEDITEQQALSNALRESEQRERRRAAELESVMNAAPVGILIAHDRACHNVTANATARRLLRLEPGESPSLTGPGVRAFDFYRDGEAVAPDLLPMQQAALSGEPIPACELTLGFTAGDQVEMLVNAVPLHDESGRVRGAAATFFSIDDNCQAA